MTHKISPTQLKTLAKIIAEYDAAVSFELKRWGVESATKVADKGVDPCQTGSRATIHALIDHGYVKMTGTSRHHTERLRKGAFGRWIGGTHQGEYVQQSVVPTQKGRDAVAPPPRSNPKLRCTRFSRPWAAIYGCTGVAKSSHLERSGSLSYMDRVGSCEVCTAVEKAMRGMTPDEKQAFQRAAMKKAGVDSPNVIVKMIDGRPVIVGMRKGPQPW